VVIQLAKEAVGDSGRVVAICSKRNFSMVKSLGADEVSEANIPWWLNENYKMHRYLPDIPETRILW